MLWLLSFLLYYRLDFHSHAFLFPPNSCVETQMAVACLDTSLMSDHDKTSCSEVSIIEYPRVCYSDTQRLVVRGGLHH